ncbi:MAG: cellulase family glycosylhydrolase [Leptospiraceae bacterium]|nr:cellulase family glycosylhydrolase [Leptospiraceae bacterium]
MLTNDYGKYPGFGMNVVIKHPNKNSLDTYLEKLVLLKVEWVRLELNFYDPISKELNLYFLEKLKNENIKILGLLTGLVPGTFINCVYPALNFKNPLEVLDSYLEFCRSSVKDYKDFIHVWEIWNEANTLRFWIHKPNHADYYRLAKASSEVIREIDPDAKLVLGGIMGEDIHVYAPYQTVNFLKDQIEFGIDKFIDFYNIHPYIPACYFSRKPLDHYLTNVKANISSYLDKYKDVTKPTWITEFGICPLWTTLGASQTAVAYRELYKFSIEKKIPFFLWTLTDFQGKEYSRFNPETAFGLLNWELDEKEIFKCIIAEFSKE